MESARQIAALPVRREADGSLLVLLVTSRDRRRWVIPKGWPWPDREDCVAAAEEAREEAGVLGRAHAKSIGVYTYCKRRPAGPVEVSVTVYPLEVTEELASWPEGDQRQRSWSRRPTQLQRSRSPSCRACYCIWRAVQTDCPKTVYARVAR